MSDLSRRKTGFERGQVMARDVFVGDDRGSRSRRQPGHVRANFADETVADQDVVTARPEIDPDPVHNAGRALRW